MISRSPPPALPTPVSASHHGVSTIRLEELTSADHKVQPTFCDQPRASPTTAILSSSFLPSYSPLLLSRKASEDKKVLRTVSGRESGVCLALPALGAGGRLQSFLLAPSLANTEPSECLFVPDTNTPMLLFLVHGPPAGKISVAQRNGSAAPQFTRQTPSGTAYVPCGGHRPMRRPRYILCILCDTVPCVWPHRLSPRPLPIPSFLQRVRFTYLVSLGEREGGGGGGGGQGVWTCLPRGG